MNRRSVITGLLSGSIFLSRSASLRADTGAAGSVKADRILVMKAERRLHLLRDGNALRTYSIGLGRNPVGPKVFELDGRTPEGTYAIDSRNENSEYYLSLHVSYPSPEDSARAAKYGIPAGGGIVVHGTPLEGGPFVGDWTDGCIAVTNAEMREIWDAVDVGTPIEIRP